MTETLGGKQHQRGQPHLVGEGGGVEQDRRADKRVWCRPQEERQGQLCKQEELTPQLAPGRDAPQVLQKNAPFKPSRGNWSLSHTPGMEAMFRFVLSTLSHIGKLVEKAGKAGRA